MSYACSWCGDTGCDMCGRLSWQDRIAFHALGLVGIAITMALLVDALQDALTCVPPYFREHRKALADLARVQAELEALRKVAEMARLEVREYGADDGLLDALAALDKVKP